MNLQQRIELLSKLGKYILSNGQEWISAKEKAGEKNPWFTKEFTDIAANNIALSFLEKQILENWVSQYELPGENKQPRSIGIIMAGNIPMVGFHDFLSVFITGNWIRIKPSSKDDILLKHLTDKLIEWEKECEELISYEEMLKGCDAYIATGSNNSSRYFEYYFSKYPHIIRRNRTSVSILDGSETINELELLADDVHLFFGLGCRNITKIFVPENYDFIPLLKAFSKYDYLSDHHKYKNNYDYHLAIHILNNKFYMSGKSIILVENKALFSPLSQLNYEFYSSASKVIETLKNSEEVQCIAGHGFLPFGTAQSPAINDYADGVDTVKFLSTFAGQPPVLNL